jgi:DNA-binding transcriptional regulator YbjK
MSLKTFGMMLLDHAANAAHVSDASLKGALQDWRTAQQAAQNHEDFLAQRYATVHEMPRLERIGVYEQWRQQRADLVAAMAAAPMGQKSAKVRDVVSHRIPVELENGVDIDPIYTKYVA